VVRLLTRASYAPGVPVPDPRLPYNELRSIQFGLVRRLITSRFAAAQTAAHLPFPSGSAQAPHQPLELQHPEAVLEERRSGDGATLSATVREVDSNAQRPGSQLPGHGVAPISSPSPIGAWMNPH
jgi:hypothetical protein